MDEENPEVSRDTTPSGLDRRLRILPSTHSPLQLGHSVAYVEGAGARLFFCCASLSFPS